MSDRESALKNRNRRMLFNYIKSHPGVTFGKLREVYDLTDGNLRYHLGYLEKKRMVKAKYKGGKKVFYPEGMSGAGIEHPGEGALNREQRRILKVVKQYPGITRKEISQITNLGRSKLDSNLKRLRDQGIIRRYEEDGVVLYEYTSKKDLKREMFKLLVIKLIRDEIDEETFNVLKDELENE